MGYEEARQHRYIHFNVVALISLGNHSDVFCMQERDVFSIPSTSIAYLSCTPFIAPFIRYIYHVGGMMLQRAAFSRHGFGVHG